MRFVILSAFTAALFGCGGSAGSVETTSGVSADTSVDAGPTVCDLGARGGPVVCDPNDPWWFVASSDGHTDTFATCANAACPLTVACFVGSQEGYCR